MRDEFVRNLYGEYFDLIFKYCLSKLDFDQDAAANCAHEVFDKAQSQYEKLIHHPNFSGWLFKTAKHSIHKQWKYDKKSRALF